MSDFISQLASALPDRPLSQILTLARRCQKIADMYHRSADRAALESPISAELARYGLSPVFYRDSGYVGWSMMPRQQAVPKAPAPQPSAVDLDALAALKTLGVSNAAAQIARVKSELPPDAAANQIVTAVLRSL